MNLYRYWTTECPNRYPHLPTHKSGDTVVIRCLHITGYDNTYCWQRIFLYRWCPVWELLQVTTVRPPIVVATRSTATREQLEADQITNRSRTRTKLISTYSPVDAPMTYTVKRIAIPCSEISPVYSIHVYYMSCLPLLYLFVCGLLPLFLFVTQSWV